LEKKYVHSLDILRNAAEEKEVHFGTIPAGCEVMAT
jgi:hypothetical protein